MKGSFNLTLTRLIKGKYSINYYDKYSKLFNHAPFKEPLNEHFVSHNMFLFLRKGNEAVYQTDTSIAFSEIPYLSPLNSVFNYYGKPYQFSIYKLNNHILSIAAYNNQINTEKSKTILYLFDNKLILGEYMFLDITEKKFKDIYLHYFFKKYIKEEIKVCEVIYIEDDHKNMICINWNGFDLSIKYMCSIAYNYLDDFKNYYNTSWKFKVEKDVDGINENHEIPSVFI